MTKCSCAKCTEADNRDKQRALEEWNNDRHDIKYESWDWECGDGCCSDYGMNLYINDYLVTDTIDQEYPHIILDFLGIEYKLIGDD